MRRAPTVIQLLDDKRRVVFTLYFPMSERLPSSPPVCSPNRPGVGGQRLSLSWNLRPLAVIWGSGCAATLPLLSELVLTDSQVNAQQLTVTFRTVEPKRRPEAAANYRKYQQSGVQRGTDERRPFIKTHEEAGLLV